MSNIYLKVTIKKNWHSQNFDFLSLKNLSPDQYLGSSNPRKYHWVLKFLVVTEKLEVWEQNCVWLFYYFNFKRHYGFKVKESMNKYINFNEKEAKLKMENLTHSFRKKTLCFRSYKMNKLKVKLRFVGACEKKERASSIPFVLSEETFFNIFV